MIASLCNEFLTNELLGREQPQRKFKLFKREGQALEDEHGCNYIIDEEINQQELEVELYEFQFEYDFQNDKIQTAFIVIGKYGQINLLQQAHFVPPTQLIKRYLAKRNRQPAPKANLLCQLWPNKGRIFEERQSQNIAVTKKPQEAKFKEAEAQPKPEKKPKKEQKEKKDSYTSQQKEALTRPEQRFLQELRQPLEPVLQYEGFPLDCEQEIAASPLPQLVKQEKTHQKPSRKMQSQQLSAQSWSKYGKLARKLEIPANWKQTAEQFGEAQKKVWDIKYFEKLTLLAGAISKKHFFSYLQREKMEVEVQKQFAKFALPPELNDPGLLKKRKCYSKDIICSLIE